MNIGNKYSDAKLYRGIKTANGLPLLSEDIIEFSDTIANKNNYLLSSILGSGLIKDIDLYYDATGVKFRSPAVLNIEGDICLIKNSEDNHIATLQEMYDPNIRKGVICVVGWYQHITSSTVMKEYGGVDNSPLDNDLFHQGLSMQVSTRYQFRWDTAISLVDNSDDISTITITARDSNGDSLGTTYIIDNLSRLDSIYTATPPAGMDYAIDKLYIIPLLEYSTFESPAEIESIHNVELRRPISSSNLIKSTTEPTGRFYEGTVWYNPDTSEFKNYVEGLGFLASSSRMGFLQYQFTDIASDSIDVASNLVYQLDFPSLEENDIIEVTYEGLQLQENSEYLIDVNTKQLTLLNFTRNAGEKLVVSLTRLIESSNVTSLTNIVTKHLALTATNLDAGHVRLSDSTNSDAGMGSGYAATPKAVKDSKILKDTTTGNSYRLVVESGTLYIENTVTHARNQILTNLI